MVWIILYRPEYWQELQLLSSQKSLKALAKDQLGVDIQTGEHNSVSPHIFMLFMRMYHRNVFLKN